MKLLLTHGYFLSEDPKEREIMKPYAPLGILYLSSHLRSKGFSVDVYDSTFGSKAELFRIIQDGPPAAIGIYANLMTRPNAVEIVRQARAAGWKVIVGGPEPANYAEEYLDAGAHVVVAGEAELTLESLLSTRLDPLAWPSIQGICYRTPHGFTVRTAPAALIKDLTRSPGQTASRFPSNAISRRGVNITMSDPFR